MRFWDASFHVRGDLWAPKAPERMTKLPKVVEKVVQRQLVERVKSMAGTVRERHGEVPGRVQEPVFSGTRCEGFPRRSREGFGMIFCDFGCTLGVLGAPFSKKNVFFSRSGFRFILKSLLGGAGARGLVPLSLLICKYWN